MRLSHQRRGGGPPLLLIHGIGSQWQMWRPVLGALAAERAVIAVDLPGFGDSLALDEAPGVPALARSLASFAAELGVERPHVAGNSLGGAVALELGRLGVARSVCALSPLGFGRGWEMPFARLALRATRLSTRAAAPAAGVVAARPWVRRATAAHLMAHPERMPGTELAGALRGLARAPGFRATLQAVIGWDEPARGAPACPTTIAWGERDRLLVFRTQSARARVAFPDARHVTLRGCGHVPTWDDPGRVARVLLEASAG